jgi:hypothetical protein
VAYIAIVLLYWIRERHVSHGFTTDVRFWENCGIIKKILSTEAERTISFGFPKGGFQRSFIGMDMD